MSKQFGTYLIKGTIATTSQATLLLAYGLHNDQKVVLKVFDPKLYPNQTARESLLRHCQTLQNLPSHPNVLPIMTVGQDNFADDPATTYIYITMPYRSDGTVWDYLNQRQRQQQPLPLPLVLQWVAELADALAHIHAHGLRHGDVKAENVLLEPTDDPDVAFRPQLADFMLMRGTAVHPVGSYPYMSPEQVRDEEPDSRSDLYALGVLLYLLLAGQLPFDIKKPADLSQHLYAPFEPPRTAPPQVQAVVAKAMNRDKNGRYATAGDLAADLRQVITTLHPATPPVPPPAAELPLVPTDWSQLDRIVTINVGERLETHTTWEAPSEYRLIVSHLYDGDRIYYLRQGYVRLGRDPQRNDIVLTDPQVSRQHAILERIPKRQWQIVNLKGANKLFLGGKDYSEQTEPIPWDKNETLRVGPYFLRWQDVALVNGPVAEEPDELETALPSDEASLKMTVEPDGEVVKVDPDATVPLKVTLHNRSEITNHYRLEFVGVEQLPLRWQNPAQPLALNADEQGTQEIRLTTFPNSAATAGRYPCQLRVYGANTGGLLLERPLTIEIPAFDQLAVDMHPSRIRHGDATQIRLENRGNTPQTYRLLARDQGDELLFYPYPDRKVVVPNGATVAENLEVRGKKRPWLGGTKTIPFTLDITALGQVSSIPPQKGELILSPRLPGWFVTFFILAALLLTGLAYLIFGEVQANAQEQITGANSAQATAEARVSQSQINLNDAEQRVNSAQTENERIAAEGTRSVLQVTATAESLVATQTAVASQATLEAQNNIPPNNAPTGITLDKTEVAENKPAATLIGTLTTQDADSQDIHTYSLTCETTPDDNAAFAMRGNQLLTGAVFDFETQNSYTICIQSNDRKGGTFEQLFTIGVTDANDAPTGLTLSSTQVNENVPVGSAVGTFTTADPDKGDNHKYTLIAGSGSGDNASFVIDGATLKINVVPNFEATKNQYSVLVQSEDQAGEKIEQKFTVKVVDVNEPGTAVTLDKSNVNEHEDGTEFKSASVGTIKIENDPENSTYELELTSGKDSFKIEGTELKTQVALDHEATPTIAIKIQATDSTDPEIKLEQEFTITINDVNEDPNNIRLAPSSVEENKESATVGTLTAVDPEGDVITFRLSDSQGDCGEYFIIVSDNQLHTKTGLEHEGDNKGQYCVFVVADDGTNEVPSEKLTITTINVPEPPTLAPPTPLTVTEGATALITKSMLEATDQDASDNSDGEKDGAKLLFVVTEPPSHGILVLSSAPATAVNEFHQSDINAETLVYIHTGSDSANDKFKFTVEDTTGLTASQSDFTFTIIVNARPVVEKNLLIINPSIAPGSTFVEISDNDLKTTDNNDADNADKSDEAQIVYTLQARGTEPEPPPPHGTLCKVPNPESTPSQCKTLMPNDTFTQEDIANGRLRYTPDSNNPNEKALDDYFLFTVRDKYGAEAMHAGQDGTLPNQYIFEIVIGPRDVTTTPLTVAPNVEVAITSSSLTTSVPPQADQTSNAGNVQFTIKHLSGGTLKLGSDQLGENSTFTQADVPDMKSTLKYTAPPDEGIQCLSFTVSTTTTIDNWIFRPYAYTLKFVVDDGNEPAINADGDCPALPAQAASQQNRLVASVYPFRGMVY